MRTLLADGVRTVFAATNGVLPRCLAVAVALLVSLAAPLHASILVNGSFESTPVVDGGYSKYSVVSTGISGWTVIGSSSVGDDVAVVSTTFQQNGITFQAQHGNQWLDLSGESSNSQTSGVSQIIATVIGVDYLISFFVGSAEEVGSLPHMFLPATVDLSINDGNRVSFTNSFAPSDRLDWKEFTYKFTATSSTTNIKFFNGSASNNDNSALDNVTVDRVDGVVPEPVSALVWGGLMLGVGAVVHTRRAG